MKVKRLIAQYVPWKRRLLLPLLFIGFSMLLLNLFVSNYLAEVSDNFLKSVSQEQEVKSLMSELRLSAYGVEAGQYAYILSNDDQALVPHKKALNELPGLIRKLKKLSFDDPVIMTRASELEQKINQLTLLSTRQIREFANKERSDAYYFLSGVTVPGLRRDIDALIQTMVNWQSNQIALATRESGRLATWSRWTNYITVALLCLLAAAAVAGVNNYVKQIDGAHDEIKALNQDLESQVRDRSGEILRANEEIQRFAYIVSHDLRAPLVNIMGFTSELEDANKKIASQHQSVAENAPNLLIPEAVEATRDDMPEAISFIRASTEKMDRLINAILDLSRAGQRVLDPVQVDMNVLIGNILDSMAQQIEEAEVEISVESLPELHTDFLAIEQIFANLIENAVKYRSTERPSKITITGTTEGAYATFDIIDNGRGIAESDQKRIFELFRRAGSQEHKGEGLGLAFVQMQIRRLRGTIKVSSVLGEGSTFKLRFPRTLTIMEGG